MSSGTNSVPAARGPGASARCEFATRTLAIGVGAVGGVVLAGWALDLEVLKRGGPGPAAMNPATALYWLMLNEPPPALAA